MEAIAPNHRVNDSDSDSLTKIMQQTNVPEFVFEMTPCRPVRTCTETVGCTPMLMALLSRAKNAFRAKIVKVMK